MTATRWDGDSQVLGQLLARVWRTLTCGADASSAVLAFYGLCDGFGLDPDGLPRPVPFEAPAVRAEAHRAAVAAQRASDDRTALMAEVLRQRQEVAVAARREAARIVDAAMQEGLHGDTSGLERGVALAVAGLIEAGLLNTDGA